MAKEKKGKATENPIVETPAEVNPLATIKEIATEVVDVPKSRLDILLEKEVALATHGDLFASELDIVRAQVKSEKATASIIAQIAPILDKYDYVKANFLKSDSRWTMKTSKQKVSKGKGKGDNPGDNPGKGNASREARIYNGIAHKSAKALCDYLGYDVGANSGVRVLASHEIGWYGLPIAVVAS